MKYKTKSKKSRKPVDGSLCIPMDYPWKVLGYLADDLCQFLTPREIDRISAIVRNRDLDGLFSLTDDWGLLSMPSSDGAIAFKRARYQLAALLKKFRFNTERAARIESARVKLLAGEDRCHSYNLEGWKELAHAPESWVSEVFTYARSFMEKLLGPALPDPTVMTDRSRHGPGATLDTKCGRVSSYFKFEKWPYQCTRAALRYARNVISSDERWLGALEDDYRSRFNIPKWRILDRQVFWDTVLEVVDGNRIAFVPKDARTERSIAIEPTMNLYLQLGVDGFIRQRLKRWGVDLDDQKKNQTLAFHGSVEDVDPFVTIDLANASNTISLGICRLLLPREWLNYLLCLRSPKGVLGDDLLEYEMISSMGNGYTFALESAIFTAIIYAVTKASGAPIDTSQWAVFGDDLIVRQSLSEKLIAALTKCGFEINVSKSCLTGKVRESCGCDWFQGTPVRPVFLKDFPKDVSELFSDINRLQRILKLRWEIEESKTVSIMKSWIPESFRKLQGPVSDTDFDTHVHVPIPIGKYRNGQWLYKRLVRRPRKEKASKFLFRKLMHDLHPLPPPKETWRSKLTSGGSRFSVYSRGADTLSITCSAAWYWQSEYGEWRP